MVRIFRLPGFWFTLLLLALITLVHYNEVFQYPSVLPQLISHLGLERNAFERILYLAPIVWAGFIFGWRGAFITSLAALACMLPRAIFISLYPVDAILETMAVFIIGNVLSLSFASLRREREYRTQLEKAKHELQANVQVIQEDKKQLATLNSISSAVSQSLDLDQTLDSAINSVVDGMQADIALLFLLDPATGKLSLAVYRGVPAEFARGVDSLGMGEGFNGQVAASGEPLSVDDASRDPRLTREVVSEHGVRSLLSVPLMAKGKVNGTLCIAMRCYRSFRPKEAELLTAIGNQISVAIENARLYRVQQEAAEKLRVMQQNLRFYLMQATRAQEEERKRISHELHDDTIQSLVVLSRQLDALASDDKGMSAENRLRVEKLWQQTDSILQGVRRLSQDLRPAALDRLGLLPALEWLASNVTEHSGIVTRVNVTGKERRLPEETAIAIFRITQEALRNVWRHSGATSAGIKVDFDAGKTTVTVNDNGQGFKFTGDIGDMARAGKLGLAGMQERAQLVGGTIEVQSQPGKGTSITVNVPY